MSLDGHPSFSELGLSDEVIMKICQTKKLRLLSENLDESCLTFVETLDSLSGVRIPAGVSILVREGLLCSDEFDAIIVANPRFVFWSLYELIERSKKLEFPSKISSSCKVGTDSNISKTGVIIEDNVFIDSGVVVKSGVTIKSGAKIGPGCVLGSDGLEVKDTIFGRIVISHKGGVIIGQNVEIGALCTINQGLGDRATQIGAETKIDCGVHIAHSCFIGPRNIIAANTAFGGSVTTGSDIFFGINCTIKNGVKLADGCFVGASSFVSKTYNSSVKLIPRPAKPLPFNLNE